MRHVELMGLVLTLFGLSSAAGQPALPPNTIAALKRSTLYISLSDDHQGGTGFVIETDGDRVIAATCAHVIHTLRAEGLRSRGLNEQAEELEAVTVHLSSGTEQDRTAQAKVLVAEEHEDLAIIEFRMSKPPRPLKFAKLDRVSETTPAFVLGFPFGKAMQPEASGPSITVSRASIASIARDADGFIEKIQLDGELNPGNSGGPVVNQAGEVIGVAVSKVFGTNISFIHPITSVEELLAGRLVGGRTTPVRHPSKCLYDISATLADPLGKVKAVAVLTAPQDAQSGVDSGKPGRFKRLAKSTEHSLEIQGNTATGRVMLPLEAAGDRPYMFQLRLTYKDNRIEHYQAKELGSNPLAGRTERAAVTEDFGSPAEPLAAEIKVNLPDNVETVQVAGAGRYLCLKLRGLPALSIFDTFEGRLVKHIGMQSDEFKFAAGGNVALVYLPDMNIFRTYDLRTFEQQKSKPNPFGPVVTDLVMGHSRGTQALIRYGSNPDGPLSFGLLDTTQLQEIQFPAKERSIGLHQYNSYRDAVQFRPNSDMSMIGVWQSGVSPSGVGLLLRRGNGYEGVHEGDSAGAVVAGDDGFVYTSIGQIRTNELRVIDQSMGGQPIPAIGGLLYLRVSNDGKMTVYASGKTVPLGPIGDVPDWPQDDSRGGRDDRMTLDQRIIFMPDHGRIVFIPRDQHSITIRPFDLKASLDSSGVDYLVVTSIPPAVATVGQVWEYQINALSRAGAVKFSASLVPDGMKVSETGLVTWTPKEVPPNFEESIMIEITDGSKETTFHKFRVAVAE